LIIQGNLSGRRYNIREKSVGIEETVLGSGKVIDM
jgi:hypothetical protein